MNMLAPANSNWMQTFTGQKFWPLSEVSGDIRIDDIANPLSKLCRYGGHCLRFYSVAEHCVHVANAAPQELKLTALMHDASEAYLCDIPRPIKPHLPGYYDYEAALMAKIAERFKFEWPLPAEVKRLDAAILADERFQNMAHMDVPSAEWGDSEPKLHVRLQFWTPEKAAFEFLALFYQLGGHF